MKRENRAKDPAPAGDFNRTSEDATSDALVVFVTEYGMTASPEEHEKVLLRIYGPDRLPGTEARRRSQEGRRSTPEPRTCAQCGEPLTWRPRFCSQACWREWHEDKPEPLDSAEMKAEMRAALDDLRAYIEDQE